MTPPVLATAAHEAALREARAVFGRFLACFTAADTEGVAGLFWPDALVWGTTMQALARDPDAVRAYFTPLGTRPPGARRAMGGENTAVVASARLVLISGTWRTEPGARQSGTAQTFRISLAVSRRGAEWRIAQFHNSPLPAS